MIPVSDRPLRSEDHARQEVEHTTCYMCACRCGIKLTLQDGRVRFIQGTRNHPVNQGVLCAKGSAGIMKQYSAAKLRQPLVRRAGTERGEGAFEPISWDRALDLLTARLKTLRSTDPKKLEFIYGFGQRHATQLRILAVVAAFAIPLIVLGAAPTSLAGLAFACGTCLAGLVIERWLFFAEAEHVVRLYHGQLRV